MTTHIQDDQEEKAPPLGGAMGSGALLLVFAVPVLLSGMTVEHAAAGMVLLLVGMTLAAAALGLLWMRHTAHVGEAGRAKSIASLHNNDPAACVVTNRRGRVLAANPAARAEVGVHVDQGQILQTVLEPVFAMPSVALNRITKQAVQFGYVREQLGSDGVPRLLTVSSDRNLLLWRIENATGNEAQQPWRDGLPYALISIRDDGGVSHMNRAAREMLGGRRARLEDIVGEVFSGDGVYGVDTPGGVRQIAVHIHAGPDGVRDIILLDPLDVAQSGAAPSDSGLEAIPIALVKLTRSGRILEANKQARDLLGDKAVQGAQLARLVEGLGRPVRDWLDDVAAGRTAPRPEMVQVKNKEDVFVQIALNPVHSGGEAGLVAVLTDATELKNLEAQFVQSQKMQAIGQLAGGVAHDFNNLLTAISGHCDLLLMRHDRGDPDYGDLVQINQNANRAASLVGQLLAFSRKQTMQLEALDLRNTIGELIHLLNRLVGERIRLQLRHGETLPQMRADKRQLEQVLMNLVVNARDAMPDGGTITIETSLVDHDGPVQRNRVVVPAGTFVSIVVRDEGVGIPADKCAKIFEPFYTTKKIGEGTGLGLSTAYGIVKQTGGYIFVDSVEGQGTTFTLLFPALTADAALALDDQPKPEAVSQISAPHTPRKETDGVVLLVEDEAPVRAFASRALRMRGYTVLEAECAEDALETLSDASLEIDVFVTDVVMPGMDGPTWVREARKARPEVRVVFVSGYAEDSFTDANSDIPNSVFLPKPFSLSELTAMVQGQMH